MLQPAAPAVPRFRVTPPAVSNAAEEAIRLAASAGLVMDPWQEAELRNSLGERADGSWAASEVALIIPRQNGKGAILEARVLAGLFLFEERMIVWSAHEFKTAQEAYRRLLDYIEGVPHLNELVKRKLNNTTETSIELHTGQRVRFVARSTGSGRGFSGDVVILDEAYELPAKVMAALIPTMAARPNRQLWFTSSAPLPGSDSDTLRRLCRRGREGMGDRFAYSEYCANYDFEAPQDFGKYDLDNREEWWRANPGMEAHPEHGITVEAVETERGTLTAEDFARERLGIWFDEIDPTEHVIKPHDWADRLNESSTVEGPLAMALDVSPDGGSASIAVSDGRHVEVIEHRPRTGWVVDRLTGLVERWKPLTVVLDPKGPAGSLLASLKLAGIEPLEVNGQEHAQACGGFLDAVIEDRISHIGQVPLDVAVAGATRRTLGDAWAWSRRHSTVDISPLVAVTLARWAVTQAEEEGPSVYEDRGMVSL